MILYIDGCDEEALKMAQRYGAGITTNPTIVLRDRKGYGLIDTLEEMLRYDIKEIFFQIGEDETFLEKLKDFPKEKIVIKLPWYKKAFRIHDISKKLGFRTCATAVYEERQLVTAIMKGVDYIAVYYDRMKRKGISPHEKISRFRKILDRFSPGIKILAASLRSLDQALDALHSGADAITLPKALFKEMIDISPYVMNEIEKFNEDLNAII